MNWFQQNRFLGTLLAALGLGTLACLIFLWLAKGHFDEAKVQFDQQAGEMSALQRHNPYPTDGNLRTMKTQAEEYAGQLNVLKEELKTRVLPPPADMKPNEFQARLRQAMASVGDKARVNKVKLPDNFFLGFDEFAGALPETAAAPLLGQQLAQVELLMNVVLDARVVEVTSLTRAAQTLLPAASASPSPAGGRKPNSATPATPIIEWAAFDVAFTAPSSAARRALNQISTNNQQLYVIRTLQVLNEKEKGPPREAAGAGGPSGNPPSPKPAGSPAGAGPALSFIVGEERVRISARVEMLRFNY